MADFCNQCMPEIRGQLADLTSKEEEAQELYRIVLCEGCGPIQVNNAGDCISNDCLEKGHKQQLNYAPFDYTRTPP